MRILFAGTPATAVPSLRRLVADGHELAEVLTRPPARAGRKHVLRPSAIHAEAEALGIPVDTPTTLKDPDVQNRIAEWQPEAVAVVAYGLIVPAPLLDVPEHGWVNLHFSLLPAWRGAAPVQHAIAAGDPVTGACTFRLEKGLDTGPVFSSVAEPIGPSDTAGDLLGRLAEAGADLLAATFRDLQDGRAQAAPQEGAATYAPTISTSDARIDWRDAAERIDRCSRAHTPAPGPWTELRGARVKLGPLTARPGVAGLAPGRIRAGRADGAEEVLVGAGEGAVALSWVAPAGRKPMPAADWLRGARLEEGRGFDVKEAQ